MPDLLKIEWSSVLLGDNEWSFLGETALRTVIMFLVILFSLRLLGKRGIKQLSIFELGVIVGLGSAAGDPMFYKDVGLLPGMVAFLIVIALYKVVTYIINRSDRFERFVEGKPAYVITRGKLLITNFKKEEIARDELFMQLRLKNITHLGQIESAIIEINGEVSVVYFPDEDVQFGLPILPHHFTRKTTRITTAAHYACINCGHVEKLAPADTSTCANCYHHEWVTAVDGKRVT